MRSIQRNKSQSLDVWEVMFGVELHCINSLPYSNHSQSEVHPVRIAPPPCEYISKMPSESGKDSISQKDLMRPLYRMYRNQCANVQRKWPHNFLRERELSWWA